MYEQPPRRVRRRFAALLRAEQAAAAGGRPGSPMAAESVEGDTLDETGEYLEQWRTRVELAVQVCVCARACV
jgi:hypothetical protein